MKIAVCELIEDFDIYPRGSVDATHVSHIVEALEAGATLPPVVADQATKRIVDGLHRARAWRRWRGPDAEIECELRHYRSDQDLFLDAMRLNASHGRNLGSYDRTVAIQRAIRLGCGPEAIAAALNMRPEVVREFKTERCAKIEGGRRVVALKLPVRHLAGATITAEQGEAIERLGGNQQVFYVNQLILLLESGLLDTGNELLMTRLAHLAALLRAMRLREAV